MTNNSGAHGQPVLRGATVLFMALAAACGTSTIYLLQPAVAEVAGSLHATLAQVGIVLACGPVGYLLGLALLVPLADRIAPAYLLCGQFCALAAALLAAAGANSVWTLGVAVLVAGCSSCVGAQLSSLAGKLAARARRGAVLGTVTAGISAGILLGRIIGGWLAERFGWREMLVLFAVACVAIAVAAVARFPRTSAAPTARYLATLRSIPGLYRTFPALRVAAGTGTLWFFAFCLVWSAIAVALSQPPYSLSPKAIGLYGVAGLLGLAATRVAGGLADRFGSKRVILSGLALAAAAALTLAVALDSPAATLAALALFDAGLFAAQVANQSSVLALDPAAPARFNSAYMLVYFVGGSLGTSAGGALVVWAGWLTTAMVAAGAILLAALITVTANRTVRPQQELSPPLGCVSSP
jgi:predicted MFS family arabinose efflux permease